MNDSVKNHLFIPFKKLIFVFLGSTLYQYIGLLPIINPALRSLETVQVDTTIYRINAGGPKVTNALGVFDADAFFSPSPGNTFSIDSPIAGTAYDTIYQTERYGTNGLFDYSIPVSNGSYVVRLHFAELYWKTAGSRVFDIAIEGLKVKDNFDIVAKAGSLTATTETFIVNVTDGILNIHFSSLPIDGGRDEPKVSAIEVLPKPATNQSPFANAGIDQSISVPVSTVILDGRSSTDPDGSVTGYEWTQISGPPAGVIANPRSDITTVSGLTMVGTYVFRLTVQDDDLPVKASATDDVTVTVSTAPKDSVIRINCGGPQLVTSVGTFFTDAYFSPTPGFTYSVASTIAGTADPGLYQKERSCTDDNGSFSYAIPVNDGNYIVKLYFAELFWTLKGQRRFDVSIEGKLELDNYDIFAKTGALTATSEALRINVQDGTLNIEFDASISAGGVNRPKISAIELIPVAMGNQVPVANAGADQMSFLPAAGVTLAGAESSDPDGLITSYMWSKLSGPSSATIINANSANATVTGLIEGNYLFSLTVLDNNSPAKASSTDDVAIFVRPESAAKAIRINAGGSQINTSIGAFFSDANYTPALGFTYSTTTGISGTTNDALYQTERSATVNNGSFSYNIAIPNASYMVILHFAEIYWTAAAKRKFDVSIEGELQLDNYDIFAKVGAFTSTTETFLTTVTDGVLNIVFDGAASAGGIDRPKVCGIEIINAEAMQAILLNLNIIRGPLQPLTVKAIENPGHHQLKLAIKSSSTAPVILRIYNAAGQLMDVKTDVRTNSTVSFGESYQPGLYFAEVWQGNVKVMTKLVRL